ncbi:unnamed protein product [Brachionus calyciflorus]|uniref:Retropepsins domain-containing protein n=1 Tax=Brachionus calyciflorus TaxID=104777 RepID=A0A814ANT4_9BILA|nr:unnamed protein product [Brachionus calyciflorus]
MENSSDNALFTLTNQVSENNYFNEPPLKEWKSQNFSYQHSQVNNQMMPKSSYKDSPSNIGHYKTNCPDFISNNSKMEELEGPTTPKKTVSFNNEIENISRQKSLTSTPVSNKSNNLDRTKSSNMFLIETLSSKRIDGVCKLNDILVDFRLDTGAVISAMDEETFYKVNASRIDGNRTFKRADGTLVNSFGALVKVQLANHYCHSVVLVVKNVSKSFILGQDILSVCPTTRDLYENFKSVVNTI